MVLDPKVFCVKDHALLFMETVEILWIIFSPHSMLNEKEMEESP